jgi:sterol desaturase/sphingolipid hydroxylase (fatty acid hydroxylase superfamily)
MVYEEQSIRIIVFLLGILIFLGFEVFAPYRAGTVSKPKRWAHNLALTAFNSFIIYLCFTPLVTGAIGFVAGQKRGLLTMVELPSWGKIIGTLVFMDFMLYVWHRLNHEVPFLWRFHRVHHSDVNMDVSTATRFHIGELAISSIIKVGLIFSTGASVLGVLTFECAVVFSTQFHHSSLNVPAWFERIFWILCVPPSMHRIHHSVIITERNTNYGTIFSLWDRVLGTLVRDVEQTKIRIGMGAYTSPEKLTFPQLLIMPFTRPVR